MKRLALAMPYVVLALLFAVSALAQVTTATFYGVVQDQTGAVIPTGDVTLTHEGTQATRQQKLNASGEFGFQFLPVGKYTLHIESPGFKSFESKGIELRAAQQARQVFGLEVGAVSEQIEVTGQAPLVNTVTGEQRESLSTTEVTELPVSQRTLSNVFTIGTGLSATGEGKFSLNGLGQAATSFTMDGIDASGNPQTPQAQFAQGFNYISVVSMEAVQEVQVSKGVFSAEYGRTLGGNINVITKSGTNDWHGSLFELFNSEELNARLQFLDNKPGTTFNQYGGSLGGPIVRDKAFIFGTIEGYQERTATVVQGNVPTQSLRDEMIAAVPDYKLILDTFPLPTQPFAAGADTGQFIGAGSVSADDLNIDVKPDIWLSDKMLLTATYVRSRPGRVEPRVQEINARTFAGKTNRLSLNLTFLGGPNWTSETRFGYNRNDRDRIDGYWEVTDPNTEEARFGGRRVPGINVLGFSAGGEFNIVGRAPHRSFDQKFALMKGKHSLKFGGLIFAREIGNENIENPSLRYQNKADLLANIPSSAQFTFGRDDYDGKAKEWGLFIQDDFRVSPRLTLNLGLRYDAFSTFQAYAPGEPDQPPHIFNYSSITFPNFQAGPFRPFDSPFDSDNFNLGPRIGFAFNPDGKSKTVIRGGFATMFSPINGEIVKNGVQNSATEPFRSVFSKADAQALGIKFPAYNEDVLALISGGTAAPSFQFIDPEIDAPYSMNFSLTVERALTDTLALETAFVGTRGVKFLSLRQYNEVDRVTGLRPNPDIGAERFYDNSESTHYYSWQTSLRKRYSANLLANIHYTWGKTLAYNRGDAGFGGTFIQDFFDIASNRGRAESDINHRFVADFLYELPVLRNGSGAVNALLGGWSVSGILTAQTGVPLNINQPNAKQGQRPDVVGADPVIEDRGDSLQYLNPAAFAPVPESSVSGSTLRPGTLGNGAVTGPGLLNLDFALRKAFKVGENRELQLRGDFLNVMNHTNFIGVDSNIESGRFGQLTSTAGARRIQLNLRFAF